MGSGRKNGEQIGVVWSPGGSPREFKSDQGFNAIAELMVTPAPSTAKRRPPSKQREALSSGGRLTEPAGV